MKISRNPISSRLLGLFAAFALAGCLGAPEIQDRWTHVEMVTTNVDPETPPDLQSAPSFQVDTQITYREILTGFVVAELRASPTVAPDMVQLNPEEQRIGTARDVDLILENSVTAGRAVQGVTGYPQLVQKLELEFEGVDPGARLTGSLQGLFLVVYMGDGEEVELEDGRDSLVVTPWLSTDYDILTQGIAVPMAAPANPPTP